jgi:hypothetical protein
MAAFDAAVFQNNVFQVLEVEAPAYLPPMVSTTGGARRPLARAAGGPRGRTTTS